MTKKVFLAAVKTENDAEECLQLLGILKDCMTFGVYPWGYGWVLLNDIYRVYLIVNEDERDIDCLLQVTAETIYPVVGDPYNSCVYCRHEDACLGNPLTCNYWKVD
jgi:hypothetical protein